MPAAREPEVLSTMATIVTRLEGLITPQVPQILDAVFECTLEMINKNFEEFPEHRTNFFLLIQAINKGCFGALLEIPPQMFKVKPPYTIFFLMSLLAHSRLSCLGFQAYHAKRKRYWSGHHAAALEERSVPWCTGSGILQDVPYGSHQPGYLF